MGGAQHCSKVFREGFHDAGPIYNFFIDLYPIGGVEGWVHEGSSDDVAALLADEEQQRGARGAVAIPFTVMLQHEMGEGLAVARVLAEYLQARHLGDGFQGAGRGGADAIYGNVLQMRPARISICASWRHVVSM